MFSLSERGHIFMEGGVKIFLSHVNVAKLVDFVICVQGVPKKVSVKPIFEFQNLGGVFLGVKNNSKNFENKKNYRLLSKILSKWTLFVRKRQKIMGF